MIENMKIKNTTSCDCGREFVITDIQKLERVDDKNFYSGVVKHYSKATCPNCGKEVILLLKQVGQTYKVINIAEKIKEDSSITKETVIESIDNFIEEAAKENEARTKNKDVTTESNELICPVCKKECKNKSGLTAHMRTHENK